MLPYYRRRGENFSGSSALIFCPEAPDIQADAQERGTSALRYLSPLTAASNRELLVRPALPVRQNVPFRRRQVVTSRQQLLSFQRLQCGVRRAFSDGNTPKGKVQSSRNPDSGLFLSVGLWTSRPFLSESLRKRCSSRPAEFPEQSIFRDSSGRRRIPRNRPCRSCTSPAPGLGPCRRRSRANGAPSLPS